MDTQDEYRARKYLLLTGGTGLLGEYLIRDLLIRGIDIAVLARPSRGVSARMRIARICRQWQRISGQAFPMPVVLEGQLTAPGWGLSPEQHRWIATNCDTLLHNAASLQFVATSPESEPWTSNLHCVDQMLELADGWGIRDLHHVSTAYVCGRRSGTILESDLDEGQQFGNDYEASKCAAELAVRAAADRFNSVTVHRPAIITGDYRSGYTSTFHGLYAPLKIASSLLKHSPTFEVSETSLVETLGLSGHEQKNFVPVDWVSEAISSIVCDPALHGQTYHLTAEHRTSCQDLAEVMYQTFGEHVIESFFDSPPASGNAAPQSSQSKLTLERVQSGFRSQMEIYQAYWRDDPVFDRTNLNRALPHLRPPAVDRDVIQRLCRFALKSNFGWPRPPLVEPSVWASDLLNPVDSSSDFAGEVSERVADINVRVLGEGGGDFALRFEPGHAANCPTVTQGHDTRCNDRLTLTIATLQRLLDGQSSLRHEIRCGAIVYTSQALSGTQAGGIGGNERRASDFDLDVLERWIAGSLVASVQSASLAS